MDRRPTMLELLLDNQEWTSGVEAARALPFPLMDGFFSARMFLVIQGGQDVGRGIGVMASHPGAEDEQLEALLIDAGCCAVDARRMIVLLPIAFGRAILERLGVAVPTVCTVDDGTSRSLVDLQASVIFQEACASGRKVFNEGTLSREEFMAIAGRDSNFRAVNEALYTGSRPEDLKLEPTILWSEREPLCGGGGAAPDSKNRPWWRIWG
jgi:hypothetical protein